MEMTEASVRRIDFTAEKLENAVVIRAKGSIDFGTFPKFNAVTDLFLNQGQKKIIFDLTEIDEMCLDAFQFLQKLTYDLKSKNGAVGFIGIQGKSFYPTMQRLFPLIEKICFDTVEAAEKSFTAKEEASINENIELLLKENIFLELSYFLKKELITGYCRILKISSNVLMCTWPASHDGKSISFNPEKVSINFRFNSPAGLLGFQSQVICKPNQNPAVFFIPNNFTVERSRMRAYERLEVNCNVIYQRYKNMQTQGNLIQAITTNISGGGINIVSRIPIPSDGKILIDLKLPGLYLKPFVGVCVRTVPITKGNFSSHIDHGISFYSIFENDRNDVIQTIIEKKLKSGGRG